MAHERGSYLPNILYISTDSVSGPGTAIGRVRPSVLAFESTNFDLDLSLVYGSLP